MPSSSSRRCSTFKCGRARTCATAPEDPGAPDQRAGRRADAALGAHRAWRSGRTCRWRVGMAPLHRAGRAAGRAPRASLSACRCRPSTLRGEGRGGHSRRQRPEGPPLRRGGAPRRRPPATGGDPHWWTAVAAAAAIPLGMSGGFLAALLVGGLTIGCLLGLVALAVLGCTTPSRPSALAVLGADDPGDDPVLRAATAAVLPATVLTLVGVGVALVGAVGTRGARPPGPRHGRRCHHGGDRLAPVLPAVAARRRPWRHADLTLDDTALFDPWEWAPVPRRCVAPIVAIGLTTTLLGSCAAVEATAHEPYPRSRSERGGRLRAEEPDAHADAVRRLELQTVVVNDATAIPFRAVLYDKTGAPWVYSSPQARTYIRVPVTIERWSATRRSCPRRASDWS